MKYFFKILCVCHLSVNAQWNYVGPAGISNGWSVYNDIATDTSGAPVIVYTDNSNQTSPCLRWNGAQWFKVDSSSYLVPSSVNMKLSINNTNQYHLFFQPTENLFPSCVRYNGTNWSYVGSQYMLNEMANHASMKVDHNGIVHCMFVSPSGLHYKKENGATWQSLSVSGLPPNIAWMSLDFDSANTAFLAYTDVNNLKINCARFVSGSWQQVGNTNFSAGYAQNNELVITPSDEIYIAYHDALTNCKKLNKQNNIWEPVGIPGLDNGYSEIEDLISDANGKLYLSTTNLLNGKAECLTFNGTNWVVLGNSAFSDTTAGYPNMAISSKGNLYATYNDVIIGKSIVKQYSGVVDLPEHASVISLNCFPNPTDGLISINTTPVIADRLIITDLFGRTIASIYPTVTETRLNLNDESSGIYFISVMIGNETRTYKIIHKKEF